MKRSMTWLITSIGSLALLVLSLSVISHYQAARAQESYTLENFRQLSNASLRGTYAGVISSTAINGTTYTPVAVSYLHHANGNGRIKGKAQLNLNGQLFPDVDYAGTYSVKPSGAISMDIIPSNGPFTGVHLLLEGVATEIEQGLIVEHHDILHTGGIGTSVVKRIKP